MLKNVSLNRGEELGLVANADSNIMEEGMTDQTKSQEDINVIAHQSNKLENKDLEKHVEATTLTINDDKRRSRNIIVYFWCTFISLVFALIMIPTFATEAIVKKRGLMKEELWFPDPKSN